MVSNSEQIPIKSWFKQLAYSLILLRQDGYPCLFYGDLYGINACPSNPSEPPVANLSTLALARKLYAYGEQRDYFNQKNCIGELFPGLCPRRVTLAKQLTANTLRQYLQASFAKETQRIRLDLHVSLTIMMNLVVQSA